MLRYFLFARLEVYFEDMIFQQDLAPPHYFLEVYKEAPRKIAELKTKIHKKI